jgi:tetratricopeptide (TPR) repeat protein
MMHALPGWWRTTGPDGPRASGEAKMKNWSMENLILLVMLAALPLAFASGFTSYERLKAALLLLGGALLLIGWATRALRGAALRLRGGLLLLPLLGLGGLALASALWAANPSFAWVASARWFALLAALLVVLDPLGRPARYTDVALAVALGSGLAALVGLLQRFGVVLDPLAPGEASDGLRASFDHARYGALSLAPTLPLLAAAIFSVRGPRRAAPAAALALVALYVGASGQPAAWVAAGAGAAVAALALLIQRGPRGFVPLTGPLVALALAAALVTGGALGLQERQEPEMAQANGKLVRARLTGDEIRARNTGIFDPDWGRPTPPSSDLGRDFARSTALKTAQARALVGVGAGNWDSIQIRYIDRASPWYQGTHQSYPAFRAAHNSYLQLAAELGLVGAALLLTFLVMMAAVALRGLKAGEADSDASDPLRLLHAFGLLGTAAAILVGAGMESLLEQAAPALLLIVSLGLLARESLATMQRRGLALEWDLHVDRRGAERYVIAGALPLLIAVGALWLASVTTTSDFYKARGDVWLRAGVIDRAEAAYRDALAVFPANDLALYNLAQSRAGRADFEDQQALLLQLAALRPHDARVFRELGQLQMRESAARAQLKPKGDVVPTEPNPDQVAPQKGNPMDLLKNIDESVMTQALFHLEKARELHPRDLGIYEQLYNAHIMRRDPPRAQVALTKGLDFIGEGDHREASLFHIFLAKSYMAEQNWKQARKHFETALELDPETPRRAALLRDLEVVVAKSEGRKSPGGHDGHDHGGHGPPGGQPQGPPKLQRAPEPPDKDNHDPKGDHEGHDHP